MSLYHLFTKEIIIYNYFHQLLVFDKFISNFIKILTKLSAISGIAKKGFSQMGFPPVVAIRPTKMGAHREALF